MIAHSFGKVHIDLSSPVNEAVNASTMTASTSWRLHCRIQDCALPQSAPGDAVRYTGAVTETKVDDGWFSGSVYAFVK